MSTLMTATDADFDQKALQGEGLVLVDFSATWCGPCKRLEPELEAAAAEMGDKLTIYKVDIDQAPEVSARYGVQGVPNMTFFKGGQVVDVAIGAMPKAAILERVRRNLA